MQSLEKTYLNIAVNVYSRQPNCDGLSLEIFWVSGNKNVDLEANNLEVNIEVSISFYFVLKPPENTTH